MLRDEIGGAAVNLVPSDKPNDIYRTVADLVTGKLCLDLSAEGTDAQKFAKQWMAFLPDGVPRACTKRSVMVLPYGGTLISSRTFVEDFVRETTEERRGKDCAYNHPFGDELWAPCMYLAKHIWAAIGETVIAAREAMSWLQSVASRLAKEGLPVTWRTPTGFRVLQSYPETKSRRVKTQFGDEIVFLTQKEDLPTIDKTRQRNGISPNFVHSMDASHLVLSVCLALDNGINDFVMVHDSYGVLAADAALMSKCLRIAFIDMYTENDVLANFKADGEAMLFGEALPPVPPKGKLDLRAVEDSDFFFA